MSVKETTIWTSQAVMAAVKELVCAKGCVRSLTIAKHTGLTSRQVNAACAKLVEHGYLKRDLYADCSVKPGCYKITALGTAALEEGKKFTSGPKGPTGKPKPRPDGLRDRAWRVLRIRRKASVPELVGLLLNADSPPDQIKRAHDNLSKFLRQLLLAGYLTEMRREAPTTLTSNGAKRFLLVRDTGPLPPIPQIAAKTVFDQNEGKQYDVKR